MPQADVLNDAPNQRAQSSQSPAVPSKRPLEDAGSVEPPEVPAKRSKPADQPSSSSSTSRPAPVPSDLLPEPCETYIQLRFQLCRFKGVYRVARVPLSFTFAHLYRYLLLLFGWSGAHAHAFEVLSHVELYARTNRPGEVKKHRSFRVPCEPDRDADVEAWHRWLMFYSTRVRDPVLRVSPRARPALDSEDMFVRGGGPLDMDDPFDRMLKETEVPRKKDGEVRLWDIWCMDFEFNYSEGRCMNDELAIKFEYDLSSPWEVDITVDPDKKGNYMWQDKTPRNYPELITAKGAPPLEDAVSYRNDIDGKKKKVPALLFERDTFERYLKGEIRSVVRNTELAVYKAGEPPASVLEGDESGEEDEDEGDW